MMLFTNKPDGTISQGSSATTGSAIVNDSEPTQVVTKSVTVTV